MESAYLERLDEEKRREVYEKLISCNIPCLIYSRGMEPEPVVLELCSHYGVPCMVSHQTTSDLMAEVIRWLKVKLAPVISIHGVLVDVFGEGVLIPFSFKIRTNSAIFTLLISLLLPPGKR